MTASTSEVQIPEAALRIRPTEWYFRLKPAHEFRVARLAAFADLSRFHKIDMRFFVAGRPSKVFESYRTINPLKIWSCARSWLQAVHVPLQKRALDRDDLASRWSGFRRGMKIFLDMSSLPFAVTNRPAMMVGLEITRMDSSRRIVEYRYLEGTPSYGRQLLTFRASADDPRGTEILHETWYRSYGAIVETLYPHYHREMLHGMHGRFKQEIEGERGGR